MSEQLRIGVDIGGTKTRVGLVAPDGPIIGEATIPTSRGVACEDHVVRVSREIEQLLATYSVPLSEVESMGVGVPGTADPRTGSVVYCPNLGWDNEPLAAHFQRHLGVTPIVLQDSRTAAWAEHLFGVPESINSFMAVTVGTGIGSGIVLDNQLFNGALNTAGEVGHSILYRDGLPCPCGNRGCVERYVSGEAILRRALQSFPEALDGRSRHTKTVFDLAAEQYEPAMQLLKACIDDLSQALVNAVNLLAVEAVVISGGLCVYEDLFIAPLRIRITDLAYTPWKRQGSFQLFASNLGPAAPMIGAAFLDLALNPLLRPSRFPPTPNTL